MALKVSVIVCAHNEARYLSPSLHSLLAQSRLPDEILVINNTSTDKTRAVTGRATLAYQGWRWPSSTAYTGLAEYDGSGKSSQSHTRAPTACRRVGQAGPRRSTIRACATRVCGLHET
jgi:hypothetical protein